MKSLLTDNNGRYRSELLIIGISLLCWGRLIGMEGMWQDDWAWVWHYFGSSSVSEFINPFKNMGHIIIGYIDFALVMMLDTVTAKASGMWHSTMFLIHTLNALILYYLIRLICNNCNIVPALCIAALYLVSPAVNNLYLMVQISYELLVCFYLISILLTVLAFTGSSIRPFFYLLSLFFAALSMAGLESFIALEFSRPLLIGYLLQKGRSKNLTFSFKNIFIYCAPFIAVTIILIFKRLKFVPAEGYTGYNKLQIFSLNGMLETLRLLYMSLYHMFFKSWAIGLKFIDDLSITSIFFILIAIGCYIAILRYGKSKSGSMLWTDKIDGTSLRFLVLYGIVILIFGILPYNAVGKFPEYGLDSRHATIAKVGYPIFVVSLLFLACQYNTVIKRALPLIFGVLFFAGLVSAHGTVDYAKSNWEHQRSIWWQMIWRAPDIKPNTFMIIDMPWDESPGGGSFVLPPAFNLAYAGSRDKADIFNHYAFALINAFRKDETNYRAIADRDTVEFQIYRERAKFYPKNLIAASYLDGYLYINDEITEPVSSEWSDVRFMLSRVSEDRIIYENNVSGFPYRWILVPEPEHDWRYYYQRANALSGRNDQLGIVHLFNEAQEKGYDLSAIRPQNLMPFIKAFYLTGDLNKGKYLFEKWAVSPAGNRERALNFLQAEDIKFNPALYKEIKSRIQSLFHDRS